MSVFEGNRELLEGYRSGDRAALSAVYGHYVEEVSLLVRRGFVVTSPSPIHVTGTPAGHEQCDLVQDIFIRAFGHSARHAYDGFRPFRPFLLRIARNLLIDRYRGSKRNKEVGRGIGDLDAIITTNTAFATSSAAPDEQLHWQHLSEIAKAYVRSLDLESQRFVRYRFEEFMTQDAVAARMQISRRRVRTLERKIQQGLRRELQRSGVHETSLAWAAVT